MLLWSICFRCDLLCWRQKRCWIRALFLLLKVQQNLELKECKYHGCFFLQAQWDHLPADSICLRNVPSRSQKCDPKSWIVKVEAVQWNHVVRFLWVLLFLGPLDYTRNVEGLTLANKKKLSWIQKLTPSPIMNPFARKFHPCKPPLVNRGVIPNPQSPFPSQGNLRELLQ